MQDSKDLDSLAEVVRPPGVIVGIAALYVGCATAAIAFRRFPGAGFALAMYVVFPLAFVLWWLQQVQAGLFDQGRLPFAGTIPSLALVVTSVILACSLLVSFWGKQRGKKVIPPTLLYFAACLVLAWAYTAVFFSPSIASAPKGALQDISQGAIPGITTGERAASPFLVVELIAAELVVFTAPRGPRHRLSRRFVQLATGLTALSAVGAATVQAHGDTTVLWSSLAVATVFGNLAVVLPFHTRSTRYARLMGDGVASVVILCAFAFFYSDAPARLLGGTILILSVFAVILLVDNWFDPRRFVTASYRAR